MGAADDVRAEVAHTIHDQDVRHRKDDRRRDWRWPAALAAMFLGGSVFLSLALTLRSNEQVEDRAAQLAQDLEMARAQGETQSEILDRLDALLLPKEGSPAVAAPAFDELLTELRASVASDRSGQLAALSDEIEAVSRALAARGAERDEQLGARIAELRAAIAAIPAGEPGEPGPQGAAGPAGPEGAPAPTTTTTAPPPITTTTLPCEPGTVVDGVGVLCEQEPQ